MRSGSKGCLAPFLTNLLLRKENLANTQHGFPSIFLSGSPVRQPERRGALKQRQRRWRAQGVSGTITD